jgi:hypothetical protein
VAASVRSARVIPLQIKMVSELHQSFIHVPKKLFANAGHQYLHPFHQVVVQPDIVPRWSHGRLATASSGSRTLIIQMVLFRSKVGTVTHIVALKSFTPYGRTRRPFIGSFTTDVSPPLNMPHVSPFFLQLEPWRSLSLPHKSGSNARNGKALHVISYCGRVESGVLTRVASRPYRHSILPWRSDVGCTVSEHTA